jgi:hypothetical protein
MKRLIISTTIAFLAVVTIGTMIQPDDALTALAAGDTLSQVVRIMLIGLLTSFLFIEPPRSMHLRVFLGGASIALAVGAVSLVPSYVIGIIDAVLYIEVAIIFAIEALEIAHAHDKGSRKSIVTQQSRA